MPIRYFRFSNPYTGTTNGSGGGTSFNDASGDWSYFLNVIDDGGNTGNVIWVNSDAYLPNVNGDLAGNPARFLYGDAPLTGTYIRLYEMGTPSTRSFSHMIFDSMNYSAQDTFTGSPTWSHQGSGRWQKTFGVFGSSGTIRAVWACNGEVRGTQGFTRFELCHRASSLNCTETGDWFSSGTSATSQTLTVNSGSITENPDQVFGGICFQWYDSNRSYALQLLGVQRFIWERPMFMGGACHFGSFSNVASEDITFINPIWQLQSGQTSGHFVMNNSSGLILAPLRRIRLINPVLRRSNTNSLAKRVDTESLVGLDHFYFRGYVSDISIVNPDFESRMTHGICGTYNDIAYTPGDLTYPRNIEIYGESRTTRGRFQGPTGQDADKCYCRLITSQTEGMITYRNLDMIDNTAQAQISGRARLEGLYLRNRLYTGYDNPGNNNKSGSNISVFGESADLSDIPAIDISITDSIFDVRSNYAAMSTQEAVPIEDYDAVRFERCTFLDVTAPTNKIIRTTDTTTIYGPSSSTAVRRWGTGGLNETYFSFKDCVTITPTGNIAGFGTWNGSTFIPTAYTPSQLPSLNQNSSNNMQFDSLSSAGIINYDTISDTSDLINKGVYGIGSVDFNGVLRSTQHSIGAVEQKQE